ncbi:hypothetical protein [Aquimarina algiphila]|uniref:hypothetical protein n=1 Tax=Aquimarina algiphila TaxID=2047982 RepID=UPI00232AD4F9|nr:hypothetical protein [Aquimarina algiphila]
MEQLVKDNNLDDFSIENLRKSEIINHKITQVLYDKFREVPYYSVEILIGENNNYGSIGKYICLFSSDLLFLEDSFL